MLPGRCVTDLSAPVAPQGSRQILEYAGTRFFLVTERVPRA